MCHAPSHTHSRWPQPVHVEGKQPCCVYYPAQRYCLREGQCYVCSVAVFTIKKIRVTLWRHVVWHSDVTLCDTLTSRFTNRPPAIRHIHVKIFMTSKIRRNMQLLLSYWEFISSRMWWCVVGWTVPNSLEDCTAFIFWVKQSSSKCQKLLSQWPNRIPRLALCKQNMTRHTLHTVILDKPLSYCHHPQETLKMVAEGSLKCLCLSADLHTVTS
jgi:hypothetical protein